MVAVCRRAVVAFSFALVSASSWAETEELLGRSEAEGGGISDSIALEYSNALTGPGLFAPFSGQNYNDETRDHTGSMELENSIYAGYKFNPDIVLGVVTRWMIHPGPSGGTAFDLKDPYLRLRHVKFLSSGAFNVEADLRLSAPLSEQSRNAALATSVASEQIFTYDWLPLIFELTTFVQHNFFGSEGTLEGEHWELHTAPGIRYRVSDNFQMRLLYEMTYTQARVADLTARHPEGPLVELGVVWDITKNLKFNPSIHTRTTRPFAAESLTLGAKLDWALL